MAAEIARTDRRLAAELLEAKNRVEQELGGVVPETAAAALDRLLFVSKQALISLDVRSPSCAT
jgi:tRNA A37 threonylcarbamoyltransferase TsaD